MNGSNIDIRALASLARLEISDVEMRKLEAELPAILHFVETIQAVAGAVDQRTTDIRNVMRDDEGAHESGAYTEALLKAAPASRDGYVVVKQVVTRKGKA